MRQAFLPYAIAFRRPVVTGAGEWRVRRGAWLRVEGDDGRVGLGEAAPLQPLDSDAAAAVAVTRAPYAAIAFDLASLDIEGQRAARPIARLLADACRSRVACNALCFAGGVDEAGAEAAEAVAQGFRTLKLKVGVVDVAHDIARLTEVRRRVGTAVNLRLDANGAWDAETAIRALRAIEPLGIEYVEDPVTGDARAVRSATGIAVAADVRSLEEGWRVVRERSADTLVLKPMALGGLVATRELAIAAIEAEIGVVVTSVFDTAVGVAGALHLAASLPGPERAHGLATVALLEDAPLEGLERPVAGELRVPDGPGLGVRLRGPGSR